MSEFAERLGMAAGNYFKSGYNCCEAIVETFRKDAGVNIDDNAFRMCSGFGAGVGHSRDFCGALAGCTMVISTLAGRQSPDEKPLAGIYDLSGEFHARFKQAFGSTACGDLMPYEFGTREHFINCLKLVNKIVQLLTAFLVEKGFLTE